MQSEVDDKTAMQMLQLKGSKMHVAEFTLTGVNQMAGCIATFKVKSSNVVVKEANAKEFGYHFHDLASLQKVLDLSENVKSLKIAGCCQLTVYTKLNYQGESKTYKQGTYTDSIPIIKSLSLKSGACPLSPMWKEWESKCLNSKIKLLEHAQAKGRMQLDSRKCSVQKIEKGDCVMKTNKGHRPQHCYYDNSRHKHKDFSEEWCKKSCTEMQAIAVAFQYGYSGKDKGKIVLCRCYFTGRRSDPEDSNRGPPCPCPWMSNHGEPKNGPPVKRGEVMGSGYADWSKCAGITCDGPEPAYPSTPAPAPLVSSFLKFPKCTKSFKDQKGFKEMQQFMKDKRKCSIGKLELGDCMDKVKHGRPSHCGTSSSVIKVGFGEDFCKQACMDMKAISAALQWDKGKVALCRCYFAGPRVDIKDKNAGPRKCPCGWTSNHGVPQSQDATPSKRGDVKGSGSKFDNSKCAPISCDGPEPPPPPFELEPWW